MWFAACDLDTGSAYSDRYAATDGYKHKYATAAHCNDFANASTDGHIDSAADRNIDDYEHAATDGYKHKYATAAHCNDFANAGFYGNIRAADCDIHHYKYADTDGNRYEYADGNPLSHPISHSDACCYAHRHRHAFVADSNPDTGCNLNSTSDCNAYFDAHPYCHIPTAYLHIHACGYVDTRSADINAGGDARCARSDQRIHGQSQGRSGFTRRICGDLQCWSQGRESP